MHGGTIEAMMSQSCSSIAERTDVDEVRRGIVRVVKTKDAFDCFRKFMLILTNEEDDFFWLNVSALIEESKRLELRPQPDGCA